jgi:hypothetical protein
MTCLDIGKPSLAFGSTLPRSRAIVGDEDNTEKNTERDGKA